MPIKRQVANAKVGAGSLQLSCRQLLSSAVKVPTFKFFFLDGQMAAQVTVRRSFEASAVTVKCGQGADTRVIFLPKAKGPKEKGLHRRKNPFLMYPHTFQPDLWVFFLSHNYFFFVFFSHTTHTHATPPDCEKRALFGRFGHFGGS